MALITIISLNPHPGYATVGLQTERPLFPIRSILDC
jgi:hypothetical protein